VGAADIRTLAEPGAFGMTPSLHDIKPLNGPPWPDPELPLHGCYVSVTTQRLYQRYHAQKKKWAAVPFRFSIQNVPQSAAPHFFPAFNARDRAREMGNVRTYKTLFSLCRQGNVQNESYVVSLRKETHIVRLKYFNPHNKACRLPFKLRLKH
jgi:hypothetical protein